MASAGVADGATDSPRRAARRRAARRTGRVGLRRSRCARALHSSRCAPRTMLLAMRSSRCAPRAALLALRSSPPRGFCRPRRSPRASGAVRSPPETHDFRREKRYSASVRVRAQGTHTQVVRLTHIPLSDRGVPILADGRSKAFRNLSAPRIHGFASATPSGESEEEGGDAEGDSSLALAPVRNASKMIAGLFRHRRKSIFF